MSAVWSTAPDRILDFPVDYLLRFLDNHGLIGVGRSLAVAGDHGRLPDLRRADRRGAPGRTRSATGDPVVDVRARRRRRDRPDRRRHAERVRRGRHGDARRRRAARCSATPTRASDAALGGFEYTTNQVVLHTDARVLPPTPRARGHRGTSTPADCRRPGDALTMTYHMNRLQSMPGAVEYCVSVNPGDRVRPDR